MHVKKAYSNVLPLTLSFSCTLLLTHKFSVPALSPISWEFSYRVEEIKEFKARYYSTI